MYNKDGLPIKISESRRVPKALCKRVGVYLQFGDKLILVGCDCGKHGFGEDERAMLLSGEIRDGASAFSDLNQVDAGLIPMHRVQDNLRSKRNFLLGYTGKSVRYLNHPKSYTSQVRFFLLI